MNKTKKYTIVFVVVCFILIGGISLFNNFSPSKPKEEVTETKKPSTIEPSSTEETKPQDTTHHETTKEEVKPETSTQKETSKTITQETPKKTEKTKENTKSKVSVEKKSESVQMTIYGIQTVILNDKVNIQRHPSVYEVLKTITNQKGISIKTNGFGPTIYIVGINGLNEFDNGPQSGWKYKVNGSYPSQSAGTYKVQDGDQIEWIYTTNE